MKQAAAPTDRMIKIITAIYVAVTAAVVGAASAWPLVGLIGLGLALIGLCCCLFWAPVGYEVADGVLTVVFRMGRKRFAGVRACTVVHEPLSIWKTLRVWGDGGLFAVSGLFWNRRFGHFRAYLTRHRPPLVLVETQKNRVLISPEDAAAFVQ